ncbi:DUF4192 domain-containing protein [Ornithinimicrobium pekingense]|uniref:DUF4192 domain-containing protein n=1 Tax=Ornithinimicrobium pekingense TaxID=384677 RepID=A0ABQ2F7C0_9MICO|nr:DUF4192 domain-containing protein [Ornithinimicrobium pekingense]GGK68460.1 hypothetical protein GCM10011509_16090 [Ornithinimicrobium pekingense]
MDEPTNTPSVTSAGPARPILLSGTPHLLATVPHLIGYQPASSVVVMASVPDTTDRGAPGTTRCTVRFTARLDLPPEDEAVAVVAALARPLARARREQDGPVLLHVIVYDADDGVAAAVGAAVALLTDEDGHRLHDLALVRAGHYLSVVGGGAVTPDGPQAAWHPLPAPADVPAVADLVLQGRFPAGSREEVAARVRRRDETAAGQTHLALSFLQLTPQTYDPLDALGRFGAWVTAGRDDPAPRDRARIAVALADRTLRDAVMARWLPRLFTVEEVLPDDLARDVRRVVPAWPAHDRVAALDRLLGLAARVPVAEAVPLLTVAGALAWGMGEGTVANEAVDLALETEPGCTMARLLREALDQGMPPWRRAAEVA